MGRWGCEGVLGGIGGIGGGGGGALERHWGDSSWRWGDGIMWVFEEKVFWGRFN